MCYHLVVKIKFHHLWVFLEIFSRPLCSFWIWTVSIFPPHLRNKGVLPQNLKCGWKKVSSDLFTLSLPLLAYLVVCFAFLFLSQSNFMLCVFFFMFLFGCFQFFFFLILFFIKKMKNTKTVCLYILVLVYRGWPLKQNFLNFISLIA